MGPTYAVGPSVDVTSGTELTWHQFPMHEPQVRVRGRGGEEEKRRCHHQAERSSPSFLPVVFCLRSAASHQAIVALLLPVVQSLLPQPSESPSPLLLSLSSFPFWMPGSIEGGGGQAGVASSVVLTHQTTTDSNTNSLITLL